MKLFAHQVAGVDWLVEHPRAALCDDQGLGKTAQLIVACDRVSAVRVLVIVPAVVLHNWAREIRAWSPRRSVQVIETGRDRVRPNISVTVMSHAMLLAEGIRQQVLAERWDAIVLDEAHMFRNPRAKRTKVFFGGQSPLCRRAKHVWIATGTPMPNNPTELWAMLAGLAPDRLRHEGKLLSWHAWRHRFCELRPTSYGDGWRVVGTQNVVELRDRLRGFMLRRMKGDVLDLPPVRWGHVSLDAPMTEELRAALPAVPEGLAGEALLEWMRGEQFSTWRRLSGVAKAPAAVELLTDELREAPAKKVVVFCHHREVVDVLVDGLREFGVVRITGDVSPAGRQREVDAFQTGVPRVAVCQIVAGGTGVTLTAAADVVFVESSFVPGENAQAADRCHRIGQTRPVLVRVLSLAGTVDEIVAEVLARKSQMLREVLRA